MLIFLVCLQEIVKRVGDLDLKLTFQCIQFKNVLERQGPDPSAMSNICLKFNVKLGGINNVIRRECRYENNYFSHCLLAIPI